MFFSKVPLTNVLFISRLAVDLRRTNFFYSDLKVEESDMSV